MTTDHDASAQDDFPLVRGGPSYHIARRLGLARTGAQRRMFKVLLILLLTWLPLALLSLISGQAYRGSAGVNFLKDPEVHARFLFVLPLLELAEVVVAVSLAVQAKHLATMGIVSEKERPRYREIQDEAILLRGRGIAEGVIVAASFAMSLISRLYLDFSAGDPSWERVAGSITPAGWWYAFVSLPVLYFFLLRWLWVFLVWAWFLYKTSRLDLELTPTHPDRTGGMGFVGWGLASFATVLMAVSAVMSAAFADEILNRGSSLDVLKYHVVIFVVVALVVLHAPMLAFAGKLTRCRFTGLLEFGALAWRHDTAFDEKWIKRPQRENSQSILGKRPTIAIDGRHCHLL